ncbi:SDR family NAD(P)-dependent oxidoreductase [Alcanivorax sp.]|uniref:SDR family NAD(P)-dependent oxidoreductase n=1 Tax=Alcanivorax sp. TaxID=1872427 RepID=UPI0025BAC5E2|nr:SDR family NAD(P)-dependent oxidoreductase [Alcanivorax sp.]
MNGQIDTSPIRLIVGASAGIGLAMTRHWLTGDTGSSGYVVAVSRHATGSPELIALQQQGLPLVCLDVDITHPSQLEDLAGQLKARELSPQVVVNCAGLLHQQPDELLPEKKLEEVNLESLQNVFTLNAFAPILLAKALLPVMPKNQHTVFASLSARVGSVSDNHLGGWYSYRASKAAQNQLMRTLAIETRRRRPQLCVLSLHPGTTDTALSKPFQRNVPADKLFSAEYAAEKLAWIIDNATQQDHGRFIAWDGQDIPW